MVRIDITDEDMKDLIQHISPKLRNQILEDYEVVNRLDKIITHYEKVDDYVIPILKAVRYGK